jgi:NADH-quinone oxidoreductase subunit H
MTSWFTGIMPYEWAWFVATIIDILVIALPLMLAVAMIIYADRKIWAAMALRRGPNVVGPFGLLQSFADGLKVFLQETIVPSASSKVLFLLAPIITFTVALMAWAVIPFQAGVVLANINVGLLYILAISSLGVYGVILAGWASNSKYPFYSAIRASAQMISYEVSIGFVLICVVLWAGSFNLTIIVESQKGYYGFLNGHGFNPLLFPMAVVFLISSMAETARAPFDLTEAESELVAGYQTEYSSMAFALYWLGEYANVILMCALNALLFWGGWLPPIDWAPLYYVPGLIWFLIKIWIFFFIFSWVKATVPRYRYDQLMRLGWKIFLPLSLFFVFLVSGFLMLTRYGANAATVEVTTFGCNFVGADDIDPSDGPPFDLTIVRPNPASSSASWDLTWAKTPTVKAIPFEVSSGSVGGSQGLRWNDASGKMQTAFISYSDIVTKDHTVGFWMSLGKPSLWSAPGYVCKGKPMTSSGVSA